MHTNEALRRLRFDPFKSSEPVLAFIKGKWVEGLLDRNGIIDYGAFEGGHVHWIDGDGVDQWTLVSTPNLRHDPTANR